MAKDTLILELRTEALDLDSNLNIVLYNEKDEVVASLDPCPDSYDSVWKAEEVRDAWLDDVTALAMPVSYTALKAFLSDLTGDQDGGCYWYWELEA